MKGRARSVSRSWVRVRPQTSAPKPKDEQPQPSRSRCWFFTDPDPVARLTGWLACFTGMLVIATGVSVYVLYKTDTTLRESFAAAERPWLSINAEIVGSILFAKQSVTFPWKVTYKNVGLTPAIELRTFAATIFPESVKSKSLLKIQTDECDRANEVTAKPEGAAFHSVFPKEEYSIDPPTMITPTNQTEFDFPSQGSQSKFLLAVCLLYKFTFSEENHRTSSLLRITTRNPVAEMEQVKLSDVEIMQIGSYAD